MPLFNQYLVPCSAHAAQERGLPDAGEGRPDWRSHCQHQRGVLFCPGPPVSAQLHLQIQSDRGGGSEETVPSRVPQCLTAGGRAEKVNIDINHLQQLVIWNKWVLSYRRLFDRATKYPPQTAPALYTIALWLLIITKRKLQLSDTT